jgi:RNA polymerase sigma-70 factor (ECF subfamily)
MSAIPYGYVDTFAPAPSTLRHAAEAQREVALLHRAQAGEAAAFAGLYETYRADIYHFIYRFMGSATDADDLTQDAFVKAWINLTTPGTPANTDPRLRIGPWFYRIANNVCLDELRHRKLVKWQTLEGFLSAFHPAQVAPDSPEREAVEGELAARVRATIDALPAHTAKYSSAVQRDSGHRFRTVLILREYGDLSYDEIAVALGLSRAAVKTVLFRARKAFRHIWEEAERPKTAAPTPPRARPFRPVRWEGPAPDWRTLRPRRVRLGLMPWRLGANLGLCSADVQNAEAGLASEHVIRTLDRSLARRERLQGAAQEAA